MKFVEDAKVTGPETQKVAAELKDGEVLLLQNTRYRVEETKYGKDDAAAAYAKELADLCDDGIFVNDAFGTAHRAHSVSYTHLDVYKRQDCIHESAGGCF